MNKKNNEHQHRLHPRLASGRAKTKRTMKKYIHLLIFLLVGIFCGNQLFNHIHAWLGIAVIIATIIYFSNRLIKLIKDENID